MGSERVIGFINQFEGFTKKPEKFLSLQEDEAKAIKNLTRELYGFTKKSEDSKLKTTDVLEELIVTDLDEEQIWQQVELQNNAIHNNIISNVAFFLAKKNYLIFPLKKKTEKKMPLVCNEIMNYNKSQPHSKVIKSVKTKDYNSSVVDDKFFKLHEMEKFLEKLEKDTYSDDENNCEINYFENSDSDNDHGSSLKYNDFFDQPSEEDENHCGKVESNKEKKVTFKNSDEKNFEELKNKDETSESNEEDEDETSFFESENMNDYKNGNASDNEVSGEEDEENSIYSKLQNESSEELSTFEARQKRLKSRIESLEAEALKEKPWQLKGEISASNRPQNSLLEEYVEFDIAARPAPVLTEKCTLKLEDVIIQRIKDKAWDDVVRKIKPVDVDIEYRKKLVLDQEKSKLSLAQIYEKEYLNQLENKKNEITDKPEVEPSEHQEIRKLMDKLFSKLDALSNFHFTPKQVVPDVKIINNMPAFNIEEVAPVATSDAALLAPEEIKPKLKGDLVGKTERSATDKKRERRQKKLKQKLKFKKLEAKSGLQNESFGDKHQKAKISQNALRKITKSSNVSRLNENEGNYVKSSNAFFSKLQNEASRTIQKKIAEPRKSKIGKNTSLKKTPSDLT